MHHNEKHIGFHGDKHLQTLIDDIVSLGNITTFIETGTSIGRTIEYFASKYNKIECLSCEADKDKISDAISKCKNLKNITFKNITSQVFINSLDVSLYEQPTLFWLDAHGYGFQWPLREEIEFITSNFKHCYILIDDFLVPDKPIFGFDSYNNQRCEHEYIKDVIKWKNDKYNLFYPTYTEHTSPIHPLRGWGLYTHGINTDFLNKNSNIIESFTK